MRCVSKPLSRMAGHSQPDDATTNTEKQYLVQEFCRQGLTQAGYGRRTRIFAWT
jgi:hypothetical protein